ALELMTLISAALAKIPALSRMANPTAAAVVECRLMACPHESVCAGAVPASAAIDHCGPGARIASAAAEIPRVARSVAAVELMGLGPGADRFLGDLEMHRIVESDAREPTSVAE